MSASAYRPAAEAVVGARRALGAMALLVTATLTSAWAASTGPAVTYTLTPTPTATLSSASPRLESRTGFQIFIRNDSGQVINTVGFRASTVVFANSDQTVRASTTSPLFESSTPSCATGASATEVVCAFGTFRPGDSVAFTLVFDSPTSGNNVRFTGVAFYKEGTGDGSGSAPNDSRTLTATTQLLATSAVKASTYVASVGGELFTGKGVATRDDLWATRVVVPKSTVTIVGVTLFEDVQDASCSSDLTICVRSAIRADGSFPPVTVPPTPVTADNILKVYLQRDWKSFKGTADIGNAVLTYEPGTWDGTTFTATGAPFPLLNCSDPRFPGGLPVADTTDPELKHCINRRKVLTSADGSESAKDWLFEIYETENGRISF